MNKYEAVLLGVVGVCLVAAFAFWGYQGHLCKIEAIKAGIRGADVRSACM